MPNLRIMSDVDVARRIASEAESVFHLVCRIADENDNLSNEMNRELIALFDTLINFRCDVENIYYDMES